MAETEVVARLGQRVDLLGGTWMGAPVIAVGAELGLSGPYPWSFYMVGRGGVLGDVDADEVAAAMVFPSPELVRASWEEGRSLLSPEEAVDRFIGCAYGWAPVAIGSAPGLERTTELLETLARNVDCTGAPLASGWRAVASPSGVPERAVWAINILREQRGGLHALEVQAAGLSPSDAIMAAEGQWMAEMYGWPPPYTDPEVCLERKQPVEAATDRAVAQTYTSLDDDALTELAGLLEVLEPAA